MIGHRPPPATQTGGRLRLARSPLVGLAAGFLSGLFGVGGGILHRPGARHRARARPRRLAHGTSLAAVLPIAIAEPHRLRARRQGRLAGRRRCSRSAPSAGRSSARTSLHRAAAARRRRSSSPRCWSPRRCVCSSTTATPTAAPTCRRARRSRPRRRRVRHRHPRRPARRRRRHRHGAGDGRRLRHPSRSSPRERRWR